MYLVVYVFNEANTRDFHGSFTVIPFSWIENFEENLQKFLNSGLNSNQIYKCFWTPSRQAREPSGTISLEFEPNFNLGFNRIFPMEGNFLCKLIKAKGK